MTNEQENSDGNEQKPVKGRGRPSTGEAKSGAERQKEFRERMKQEGKVPLTVFIPEEMMVALDNFVRFKNLKKDDVVQKCIHREIMRKR